MNGAGVATDPKSPIRGMQKETARMLSEGDLGSWTTRINDCKRRTPKSLTYTSSKAS
jgi:hypothetical protein